MSRFSPEKYRNFEIYFNISKMKNKEVFPMKISSKTMKNT